MKRTTTNRPRIRPRPGPKPTPPPRPDPRPTPPPRPDPRPTPPPRPDPRPTPPPGPTPPPDPGNRTPAELAAAIERAIRFIMAKQEEHAEALATEVGDYLVEEFYAGDIDYIRYKWRGKEDSLRDIASGIGVPYGTLQTWLSAAMVRFVLRRRGVSADLALTKLRDLGQLMDHPHAMAALARWAERERLTRDRLLVAVRFWRGWVESGRAIEDLVRDPSAPLPEPGPGPGPGPRPHPKPRKQDKKDPDSRLLDVLSMIREWVEKTTLGRADRARISSAVAEIGRLLGSPSPASVRSR